jgi:hypothetical protein
MNITGISGAVTSAVNAASSAPRQSAPVSVLKKALDTQAAGAVSLINSIPDAPKPSSGAGGIIDTFA